MKISARNQLKGVISSINEGAVNSMVTLDINGVKIHSTISKMAVEELNLTEGKEAYAIIKATEVMIALGDIKISARNKLKGKIISITEGAVNSIVALEISDGNVVSSTISNGSIKDLGLAFGVEVIAVVKATSVMIAID